MRNLVESPKQIKYLAKTQLRLVVQVNFQKQAKYLSLDFYKFKTSPFGGQLGQDLSCCTCLLTFLLSDLCSAFLNNG